jgi:D-inositol-3-phosphate glycosyltransferase
MNVYVRQLARSLGNLGVEVDIFTRNHPEAIDTIESISPNVRIIHLPGGDPEAPMEDLFSYLPGFLKALQRFREKEQLTYQAVHSHYWLSGWVGQSLAQSLAVPHIITFHTLALIKMQSRAGEKEPLSRQQVERELMAGADKIIDFSQQERNAKVRH